MDKLITRYTDLAGTQAFIHLGEPCVIYEDNVYLEFIFYDHWNHDDQHEYTKILDIYLERFTKNTLALFERVESVALVESLEDFLFDKDFESVIFHKKHAFGSGEDIDVVAFSDLSPDVRNLISSVFPKIHAAIQRELEEDLCPIF